MNYSHFFIWLPSLALLRFFVYAIEARPSRCHVPAFSIVRLLYA